MTSMPQHACWWGLALIWATSCSQLAHANDALGAVFQTLLSPANSLHIADSPFIPAASASTSATDVSCNLDTPPTSISLAPIALDRSVVHADSTLYQVTFNARDWSGDLVARSIADGSDGSCSAARGTPCPQPQWSAQAQLQSTRPEDRVMITNRRDAFLSLPDLNSILTVLKNNPIDGALCKVPVLGNVLCDVTDLINDLLHEVTTTVLGPLDDLLEPATQLLVSLLDEVGITNSEDT